MSSKYMPNWQLRFTILIALLLLAFCFSIAKPYNPPQAQTSTEETSEEKR